MWLDDRPAVHHHRVKTNGDKTRDPPISAPGPVPCVVEKARSAVALARAAEPRAVPIEGDEPVAAVSSRARACAWPAVEALSAAAAVAPPLGRRRSMARGGRLGGFKSALGVGAAGRLRYC